MEKYNGYLLTLSPYWLQLNKKLKKEAEARGERFKIDKLRRNIEMDEYDLMHWRRSLEEREALLRDISWYKPLFYLSILIYIIIISPALIRQKQYCSTYIEINPDFILVFSVSEPFSTSTEHN